MGFPAIPWLKLVGSLWFFITINLDFNTWHTRLVGWLKRRSRQCKPLFKFIFCDDSQPNGHLLFMDCSVAFTHQLAFCSIQWPSSWPLIFSLTFSSSNLWYVIMLLTRTATQRILSFHFLRAEICERLTLNTIRKWKHKSLKLCCIFITCFLLPRHFYAFAWIIWKIRPKILWRKTALFEMGRSGAYMYDICGH